MRLVLVACAIFALASCGGSSAEPPKDSAASAEVLKKDCVDPHWKEENLGLWYSVCRRPMRW